MDISHIKIIAELPLTNLPTINVCLYIGNKHKSEYLVFSIPTQFDRLVLSLDKNAKSPPLFKTLQKGFSAKIMVSNTVKRLQNFIISKQKSVLNNRLIFDTRAIDANQATNLLLLILPVCLTVKRLLAENNIVEEVEFLFGDMHPSLIALTKKLGINPIISKRGYTGSTLKLFVGRRLAFFDIFDKATFDIFHQPSLAIMNSVYASNHLQYENRDFVEAGKKIFITQKSNKHLINDQQIANFLAVHGYQKIELDEDITKHLTVIANAKHIVAVHAPIMAYLVLNKEITSLVEIFPPNVHHEIFPICINQRVKHYFQVVPHFDKRVGCAGWPTIYQFKTTPFNIDIELLSAVLTDIQNISK